MQNVLFLLFRPSFYALEQFDVLMWGVGGMRDGIKVTASNEFEDTSDIDSEVNQVRYSTINHGTSSP
jgi:hypothetical protein